MKPWDDAFLCFWMWFSVCCLSIAAAIDSAGRRIARAIKETPNAR